LLHLARKIKTEVKKYMPEEEEWEEEEWEEEEWEEEEW